MAIILLLALLVSPVYAFEDFAAEKPSKDVAIWMLDENGRTYGVKQIDGKPRVSATPYLIDIAEGHVPNHIALIKFGRNNDIDGPRETIWEEGGLYVYLSSAQVLSISSSDTDDTSAGTGARIVEVYGLDVSSAEVMNTVSLAGQSPVLTTSTYSRIFRMKVISAGASAENEGIVYAGIGALTTGKPATVQASITPGHNQTLMAIWTVPSGKKLFITHIIFSISTNKETEFTFWQRPMDGIFQIKFTMELDADIAAIPFDIPYVISSESDFEIRASASAAANSIVSATFYGWYEDNGGS